MIDTTKEFFRLWELNRPFTIDHLEMYYSSFPDIFDVYFKSHCKRSPKRLHTAILRYPDKIHTMRQIARLMPTILYDVYDQLSSTLQVSFPVETRLIVGGFGSNAYVTHDGTLHFVIELLSEQPEYLRVLVSHEMAHSFHFAKLREELFDFNTFSWDGYTSLYIEGIATYLSKLSNPGLSEWVYFTYDNTGEEWISFCKSNFGDIVHSFSEALEHWTMDEEKEWFRLSGGNQFGFNRLGYFIGTEFIQFCVKNFGLSDTITLCMQKDLKPIVKNWLTEYR